MGTVSTLFTIQRLPWWGPPLYLQLSFQPGPTSAALFSCFGSGLYSWTSLNRWLAVWWPKTQVNWPSECYREWLALCHCIWMSWGRREGQWWVIHMWPRRLWDPHLLNHETQWSSSCFIPSSQEHSPGGCLNVTEIFFFLPYQTSLPSNPILSTTWQHPGDSFGSLLWLEAAPWPCDLKAELGPSFWITKSGFLRSKE